MLSYGKVVEEVGYKHGNVVQRIRTTEESITVANMQELIDQIFEQLKKLTEVEQVTFTVHANKHTHLPNRIVVRSQQEL